MNKYRKLSKQTNVKKSKGVSLGFVELESYSSPKVTERKSEEFVRYGDDNNYFQYIIDRYNGSPTNNAIINGISEMIYGRGLDSTDSQRKPDQYAKMISLLEKDVVRKLAHDLKLQGQCAIQVIYSKDRKTIAKVDHIPVETLRAEQIDPEKESNGKKDDIQGYFYHSNWKNYKEGDELVRFDSFGSTWNDKNKASAPIEIYYIKPYRSGFYYYSPVDYQGGLQYAETEEEIANFHLNNIKNSFTPSMLINFNNGEPDEDTRDEMEAKIAAKWTGSSNAGRFILNYSTDKDQAATIETIQQSDLHNQYQFLSDEAMKKIMVAHRVVSPMLLGIKDNTGLGNNADELKSASILMDNIVIRPFQELLLDAFEQILAYNNISLNLYFKTIQPLEFTDLTNVTDSATREEETGIKMSSDLSDEDADIIYESLDGENIDDNVWEEVDAREYSEKNSSIEEWVNDKIQISKTLYERFADFITSKPSGFSYLDKSVYKIRYRYTEKYSSGKSRDFCTKMMDRTNNGVVYRLEDIDKASRDGVNKQFGHKGQAYDLFKYKGGVSCGHVWTEVLYKRKKKNGKYVEDKALSSSDVVNEIPKTYKPRPAGHKEAEIAPRDMENQGHHPNWKK